VIVDIFPYIVKTCSLLFLNPPAGRIRTRNCYLKFMDRGTNFMVTQRKIPTLTQYSCWRSHTDSVLG